MMYDSIISVIRTAVPAAVGAVLTWLAATFDVGISAEAETGVTATLVFGLAMVWYLAARALEQRIPWAGVLLGVPRPPHYERGSDTVVPPAPQDREET